MVGVSVSHVACGAGSSTPGAADADAALGNVDATTTSSDAESRRDGASSADAQAQGGDAGALGDVRGCKHAGEHRLPGTECCADEGAGSVPEYSLCCRPPGGDCNTSLPGPDAFCCYPGAKCNRKTAKCEARTCWTAADNCLMAPFPCCETDLVCGPPDAGAFPTSKRCCRPDGLEPPPGQFDCCVPILHSNDKGKMVCGPP